MIGFEKASFIIGVILILLGLIFLIGPHLSFFGKLPGDIQIEGKNFGFYFPIVTCIVISIILTIILNLFGGGR